MLLISPNYRNVLEAMPLQISPRYGKFNISGSSSKTPECTPFSGLERLCGTCTTIILVVHLTLVSIKSKKRRDSGAVAQFAERIRSAFTRLPYLPDR